MLFPVMAGYEQMQKETLHVCTTPSKPIGQKIVQMWNFVELNFIIYKIFLSEALLFSTVS